MVETCANLICISLQYAILQLCARGIEWCLRAFVRRRAVRLFLRARAMINFVMRAASTLEIANGEQRALHKFSASWNLSFIKTLSCAK